MNYTAILLCTVLTMLLGWVWYSPILFGRHWMAALGWDQKKLAKNKQDENMSVTWVLMALTTLVQTLVLAILIYATNATNAGAGAALAFWIWLGIIVTTNAATVLYEKRSPKVYYIYVLYQLVAFVLSGAIIGGWR